MTLRASLLQFPEIRDARGNLTFAQGAHLPFPVQRMFLLYDVPQGMARGGHAHRAQHQLLVMTGGRVDVSASNGTQVEHFTLDRPSAALYAPPMLWLELSGFSANATCLVLTSAPYDEADYVRDAAEFERLTGTR